MSTHSQGRLIMENVGPIVAADVSFGDLTVIVGPQATGKSIFLQTLKLLLDRDHIHDTFLHNSIGFSGDSAAFLGGYFGKGMAGMWRDGDSTLKWNGKSSPLTDLARPSKSRNRQERLFYIPAQRVMSLVNGTTQNFGQFNYGDPYALRYFSDAVHGLVQNEFGPRGKLFPLPNRLNAVLRKPIEQHLFGGSHLATDAKDFTKRLVLNVAGHDEGLPFTAWSAGQREFTPLLLGLYWLCPAGKVTRREPIEWVVIEEPEMGLHPHAILTILLLVQELLQRGYKVVLSTHSPVVLDWVWALQEFKRHGAGEEDVRRLMKLHANPFSKKLAQAALEKTYKVYFFDRMAESKDISDLDPNAESLDEAQWGGLIGFASHVGELIADVVNRAPATEPTPQDAAADDEAEDA